MFIRLHLIYIPILAVHMSRAVFSVALRKWCSRLWAETSRTRRANQTSSSSTSTAHLARQTDRHSELWAHSNVYCLHNEYKIIINISTFVYCTRFGTITRKPAANILVRPCYNGKTTARTHTHAYARNARILDGWRVSRKQTGFIYFYHHAQHYKQISLAILIIIINVNGYYYYYYWGCNRKM